MLKFQIGGFDVDHLRQVSHDTITICGVSFTHQLQYVSPKVDHNTGANNIKNTLDHRASLQFNPAGYCFWPGNGTYEVVCIALVPSC